jgi:hypothetical protein
VLKTRTLMEQIYVLRETIQEAHRQANRGSAACDHSDLHSSPLPDVVPGCDLVAEFAGDALATLEDWEAELTLEDLDAGRTKLQ